ncbi:unnamed protein product [Notodromas monacha]|uniref:DMAP1-binding domain-containing protein n=1 Tax=Notodromas monacha TaxID=399045 RepID=A0A7R9GD94_9CRUS|nr:unnamed protein product [Notodromas monacha]CAG0916937.1 unnamed protein product [Notodromas monacha]
MDPLEKIDVSKLPNEIREKLAELELELSEGDITRKGYEKKKTKLLAAFIPKEHSKGRGASGGSASPGTRAKRRAHRKLTRNESRYHSVSLIVTHPEIRKEAVEQALAAMQSRPKPSLPMPSKRTSVQQMPQSQEDRGIRNDDSGESSSDESSSLFNEEAASHGTTEMRDDAPPPLPDRQSMPLPQPPVMHQPSHPLPPVPVTPSHPPMPGAPPGSANRQ